MIDERVSVEQLRGMLRLRRAELDASLASDLAQLARVETRLRTIESEGRMPSDEIVIKRIDAMRVAELTDVAATLTPEDIGPVIKPLCARLGHLLATGTLLPTGRMIAYYEQHTEDEDRVVIHAAVPISADEADGQGLTIVDLPAIEQAATIVHRGSMDGVLPSVDALARWIDEHGYRAVGDTRELYHDVSDDESKWITELQQPVVVG